MGDEGRVLITCGLLVYSCQFVIRIVVKIFLAANPGGQNPSEINIFPFPNLDDNIEY